MQASLGLVICAVLLGLVQSQPVPLPIPVLSRRMVCGYDLSAEIRLMKSPYSVLPSDLDAKACTHILVEFGTIDTTGKIHKNPKKKADIVTQLLALKAQNSKLKIMMVVGFEPTDVLMTIANDPYKTAAFVRNIINYLKKFQFDGLDIYWRYPSVEGRTAFTSLMSALSVQFAKDAQKYSYNRFLLSFDTIGEQLSGGLPTRPSIAPYDLKTLAPLVDFMNVLAFNFFQWPLNGPVAGLQSALYPLPVSEPYPYRNQKWAIEQHLAAGVPSSLLNLVIPTIGISFTLCSNASHSPNSIACARGKKGLYTKYPGVLAYFEICQLVLNNGWTLSTDSVRQAAYAYDPKSTQWASFDTKMTAAAKVSFAILKNLGGVGLWDLVFEDVHNVCQQGNFPILTSVSAAWFTN
jgi:chitinase